VHYTQSALPSHRNYSFSYSNYLLMSMCMQHVFIHMP